MSKKVINYFAIGILFVFVSILILFANENIFSIPIKCVLETAILLFLVLNILFKYYDKEILRKLFYVLYILTAIIIIVVYYIKKNGYLDIFSSTNSLKNFILGTREKGVFVYIVLQILQVVFLPIPAAIICIVGSIIYGPLLGAIYCSLGILIGSYISFFIGKTFGYKLVSWIVGKDNTDKYTDIIRKRGGFFLAIAFLLPMFPDDILCLISGITNISFKQFFWITLITRPIGVIAMSYFGGGHIIPFSGWGIYAWIGILISVLIVVIMTYKYQDNMQTFILKKIFKKHNKN